MSHFVMSYMKQNKKRKQLLESAQDELEIIFNIQVLLAEQEVCMHGRILTEVLRVQIECSEVWAHDRGQDQAPIQTD